VIKAAADFGPQSERAREFVTRLCKLLTAAGRVKDAHSLFGMIGGNYMQWSLDHNNNNNISNPGNKSPPFSLRGGTSVINPLSSIDPLNISPLSTSKDNEPPKDYTPNPLLRKSGKKSKRWKAGSP